MTKKEKRQIREVEAVMDGKPLLKPLERVYWKIYHFRQDQGFRGVSLRLDAEEADAIAEALWDIGVAKSGDPNDPNLGWPTDRDFLKFNREARKYGVGRSNQ